MTFSFVEYGKVFPESYHLGDHFSIDNVTQHYGEPVNLSPSQPLLTLDYGTNRAGFPIFTVDSLSGPTQLELKYSEEFPALSLPQADGPWPYVPGLANSFRIETFNVTEPGEVQSYFIQGAQRWQTVRLLTNSTVQLSRVGFNSTAPLDTASQVKGKFNSSDEVYDRLFNLGAGASHVSCIDAGNAPSTWEITPEGAYIRGQTTAQSAKSQDFSNYTLTFSTKIARGGTGWRVASGPKPFGAYFVLTTEEQPFLNTNHSLLTPSTIIFTYGTNLYNQYTITNGPIYQYPLNMTISEDTWYRISTAIEEDAYVISINNKTVLSIPIAASQALAKEVPSRIGTGSAYSGSFGFGPYQDQAAYFKDVTVHSKNGTVIYEDSFTSEDVLGEYGVAPLNASVCLDGGKRDRLVWAGDFYHTVGVVAASTAEWKYLIGSIDFLLDRQLDEAPFKGLVPISPFLGSPTEYNRVTGLFGGLLDYQDLFLAGIGDFYHFSGQASPLKLYWPRIKALVEAKLEFIDPYSGLVAASPEFEGAPVPNFLGPMNGTAVTGVFAYALEQLADLADVLNDTLAAELYRSTSESLVQAMNDNLWNAELGTYSLSVDSPSNFSLTGIAWAILSGAANSSQATSSIEKLEELRCGIGYRTLSSESCTPDYELSPNTNGFLLHALFKAQRDLGVRNLTVAKTLLNDFWSSMVTQNEFYSGASWEYVHPDGSPGINRFTSLSHPWGAAPTYVLPRFVLGIGAASAGYERWTFRPLIDGLDLMHAEGTVVTAFGDIEASWEKTGNSVVVRTNVPDGTEGTFVLPEGYQTTYKGEVYRDGTVVLQSGERVCLTLERID